MMKFIFILFTAFIFITPSYACSDPPRDYFLYPDELLRKSTSVALVKVVSKEVIPTPRVPWPTFEKVQFKVLENLTGSEIKTPLTLKGIISEGGSDHFNNHEDYSFWANPFTASGGTMGDCYAYGVFDKGKTYLVFLGVGNTKAFEEIADMKNDRWLAMVRELINVKKTRNKLKN
jgi:hypothetical protein